MNRYTDANKIAPEEGAGEKEEYRKTKGAGIRRCIRFTVLLIIVAALAAAIVIFAILSYTSRTNTFDSSRKFVIKENNCKMYFIGNEILPANKITFKAEVPGLSSVTYYDDGTTVTINAQNTGEFINACWIRFTFSSQTVFSGGITLTCTGSCYIIHEGPNILNFGISDFIIGSQKVALNLQGIQANKIEVTSIKGDLTIHSANLTSTSFLSTEEGEVVFQSTKPYQAQITSGNKYYCVYAPYVSNLTAESCKVLPAAVTYPCTATLQLCNTSPCASPTPLIKLSGNYGNIYANMIKYDDVPIGNAVPYTLPSWSFSATEVQYSTTYSMDSKSEDEFAKMFKTYNKTSKSDSLVLFNIGNLNSRSSSLMKFAATPNSAYLNAKPWWMAFFSMTLLIGSALTLPVRLVPGLCPYNPIPNLYDLYNIEAYLVDKLHDPSRVKDEVAYFYSSALKVLQPYHIRSFGYEEVTQDFDLYDIIKSNSGVPAISIKTMFADGSLSSAVIISVILASFIGLVGMVTMIFALKFFFQYLGSESEHIIKYVKEQIRTKGKQLFDNESLNLFMGENNDNEEAIDSKKGARSSIYSGGSQYSDVRSNSEMSLNMSSIGDDISNAPVSDIERRKPKPKVNTAKVNANLGHKVSIFRVLKSLPNQFEVLDHMVYIIKKFLINSAEEFMSYLLVPDTSKDHQEVQLNMKEIKTLYETYCFLKSYSEVDITGTVSEKFVAKRGFKFTKREDASTEVFKKIKLLEKPESTLEKKEDENSLGLFIRVMCKVSTFDEDCIEVEAFKKEYSKFCIHRREQEILITKTTMKDTFNLEAEKMESTYIERDEKYSGDANDKSKGKKGKKFYKVDFEGMRQKIKEAIALHSKSPQFYERNKGTPLGYAWFLIDLLGVLFHFVFIVIMALIFLAIPYFFELMNGQYSLADYQDAIQISDWQYAQWNIFYKMRYLQIATIILAVLGAFYGIVSILDLFIYYIKMKFPMSTIRIFANMYDIENNKKKMTCGVCLRGFINAIEWIYIFLAVGMLLLYVFLVLEWNILGAILNPTAYLVYASSAGTFLTFLTTKYNSFKELHKLGIDGLKNLLLKEVKKSMVNVMNKILQKNGITTDKTTKMLEDIKNENASPLDTAIMILANTPIGRKAASAGFDLPMIVKILKLDPLAISEFSQKHGIPPALIKAAMHVIHADFDKVKEAIIELANGPPFNLPEGLIKCVMNLINKHSEMNIPKIVSEIALMFLDFIQSKLKTKSIVFEMVKVAFPQAINAVIALKNRNIDQFLDIIGEMSRVLYDGVLKKYKYEKSIGSEEFKNMAGLFNESGDPTFTIPDIFINVIELAKILIAGNKEGISAAIERLKPAMFSIIKQLTHVDQSIIDFLSLIFSASYDNITNGINKSMKFLTKENIRQIANTLAEKINMKDQAFFIKLFFKFLFGDRTLDDELIDDIMKELSKHVPFFKNISSSLIKNIMCLYTLLKMRNPFKYLMQQAVTFSIDEKDAALILFLSIEPQYLGGNSSIIVIKQLEQIARLLSITKNEVGGFLALIMGNFSNSDINILIKSICKRVGLPLDCEEFMLSLLKLIVSDQGDEILFSVSKLRIESSQWIMIGKKLLQPRYIDQKEFVRVGIKLDSDVVTECPKILLEDNIAFRVWKSAIETELQSQEVEPSVYNKFIEEFGDIRADKIISPTDFVGSRTGSGDEIKSIIIEARQLAYRLLIIDSQQVTTTFVEAFLHNYNKAIEKEQGYSKDSKTTNRQISLTTEQLMVIANFLSVKTIIKRESNTNANDAAKKFANILKLKEEPIIDLVTIASSPNTDEVKLAIGRLFNELSKTSMNTKEESTHLTDYGKFVTEEISSLEEASKCVQYFADNFKIPEFIIKKFLMPYDKSNRLKISDMLMLLDFVGLNDSNPLIPKQLVIPPFLPNDTPTEITLNEFKMLIASIAVGHASNLELALKLFRIPLDLKPILQAFLSPNIPTMMRVLIGKLQEMMKTKFGIPTKYFSFILALIAFFNGNGNETKLKSDGEKEMGAMQIISSELNIRKEVLQIIDIFIFKRGKALLIEPICSLLQNNIDMPGYILKGLSSMLTGKPLALENFADKLGIKDERFLDVIIHLGDFNNVKYLATHLKEFTRSPAFSYFCYALNINANFVAKLLNLGFCNVSYKEISEIINEFKIGDDVDIEFIKALMAVARGYDSIEEFESTSLSVTDKLRTEVNQEIGLYFQPFIVKADIDPNFTIMALRIRQGDFYIINEIKDIVSPMLPCTSVKNLTMGIVGMLTHPVFYEQKLGKYKNIKELPITLSFEGANNLLCKTLNINPIIARLVSFDLPTYDYLCRPNSNFFKAHHMKKSALSAIVMSLGNPGLEGIYGLVGRSFIRSFRILLEKLKILMDKFKGDEINPLQDMAPVEDKKSEKHETQTKEDAYIPPNEDYRPRNFYDKIQFTKDQNIEEVYRSIKLSTSFETSPLQDEAIELAMFNNPNWMLFNYSQILEKKKRHYNFSQARLMHILGSQSEFNKSLNESFKPNFNNKDSSKLQLSFENCWLNEPKREENYNIWGQFKTLLMMIDFDPKIVGDKYDRITMSQLVFYILLFSVKYKIEGGNYEINNANYISLISELDNMLFALEMFGYTSGYIENGFSPIRVMKFISIAIGIKISNILDYRRSSLYEPKIYYNFQTPFITQTNKKEEIEKALGHLNSIGDTVEPMFNNKIDNSSMFIQSFVSPESDTYASSTYAGTNPYDLERISEEWRQNNLYEDYVPSKNKLKLTDGISDDLKKLLMVRPKNIFDDLKKDDDTQIDVISGCKLKDVYNLTMRYEQFIVAEDSMKFVMDLAVCKDTVIDEYKLALKGMEIIKKDKTSVIIYKAILRLFCLRKLSSDFIDLKNAGLASGLLNNESLKEFFGILSANINVDQTMAENLLMIAHGNFDIPYLTEIGSKLKINPKLLNALLSLRKIKSYKNLNIEEIIGVISQQLSITNTPFILNVLNMVAYLYCNKFRGIDMLIEKIQSAMDEKPKAILDALMRLINTRIISLKRIDIQKLKITDVFNLKTNIENAIETADAAAKKVVDNAMRFCNILTDSLDLVNINAKLPQDLLLKAKNFIKDLSNLILGLIKKDISLIKDPILKIIGNEEIARPTFDTIELFITLINNDSSLLNKDKFQRMEDKFDKIAKIAESLAKIICNIIDPNQSPNMVYTIQKILGFLKCLLGSIYKAPNLFKEGLSIIDNKLGIMIKLMSSIKYIFKLNKEKAMAWIKTGPDAFFQILSAVTILLANLIIQVKKYSSQENSAINAAGLNAKGVKKPLRELIKGSNYIQEFAKDKVFAITSYLNESSLVLEQLMSKVSLPNLEDVDKEINSFEPPGNKMSLSKFAEKLELTVIAPFCETVSVALGLGDPMIYKHLMKSILSLVNGDYKLFALSAIKLFDLEKNPYVDTAIKLFDGFSEILSMTVDDFQKLSDPKENENYIETIKMIASNLITIIQTMLETIIAEKTKADQEKGEKGGDSIALRQANKALSFIKSNIDTLNPIIIMLHAIKLNQIDKSFIIDTVIKIISKVLESQKGIKKMDKIKNLINGIIGSNFEKRDSLMIPLDKRINMVVDAIVDLIFPDLNCIMPLVGKLINLIFYFAKGGGAAGKTKQDILDMARDAALLFNVNPSIVKGIMGIINGDAASIIEFIAPIAKIDLSQWKRLIEILKEAKSKIEMLMGKAKSKGKPIIISDAMKEMTKKIRDGTAGIKELFDLVDSEGDASGGISKGEFGSLLAKLQIDASEHRIDEIFSRCKKNDGKSKENDLNVEEFKVALDYVQEKDTTIGLDLIGLSKSQLIIILVTLLIILVMLLAFILLGMNAFTPGGIFNSVINSMMPMFAGVGVTRSGGPKFNKEALMKKLESMIDEIKKIMGRK